MNSSTRSVSPYSLPPASFISVLMTVFGRFLQLPEERLEILADKDGVWRCRTIFNCVDACPRGINITRAILEVSSAIVERQG